MTDKLTVKNNTDIAIVLETTEGSFTVAQKCTVSLNGTLVGTVPTGVYVMLPSSTEVEKKLEEAETKKQKSAKVD